MYFNVCGGFKQTHGLERGEVPGVKDINRI